MTDFRTRILHITVALVAGLALPATAQDVHTGNVEIQGDLFTDGKTVLDGKACIGQGCSITESFDAETQLKIRSNLPGIEFHDTSNAPNPFYDWRIKINDGNSNGLNRFAIENLFRGKTPFSIAGSALDNTLWLGMFGQAPAVGIGTTMPTAPLHIVDAILPKIRLDPVGSAVAWDIRGAQGGFSLMQTDSSQQVFFIDADAPGSALSVSDDGTVLARRLLTGVNLQIPQTVQNAMYFSRFADGGLMMSQGTTFVPTSKALVHLRSEFGKARIMVEDLDPTSSPRTLLNLQNNGRPEIVMGNSAKDDEWSIGAGSSFFLKVGALDSTSGAKSKVLTVKKNGNAVLAGSLTTGGTTCGGGCDAVFSDDYDLPSIAEHAARMKALGHLPNVGPTLEGAPINVTDKLGRMLNELEHAHLYIADQESRLSAQAQRIAAQDARIERLEALLLKGRD